jgi:choline dehydrogenase-like flavoprotein
MNKLVFISLILATFLLGAFAQYDFIVVGGGATGCTLAANLAQKGTVLLLERGKNQSAYPESQTKYGTMFLDPPF